jgi:SAM-dependent methyltransferase
MFPGKIYFQEPLSSILRYLPLTGIILDAGCGASNYAETLKKKNENILCIDLNDFREKKTGLPFCLGSISSLPIKDDSVDFIYCTTVLQYIPNQEIAINEFHRVLKPKGKLLFTVPTKRSMFYIIREMEIFFDVYPYQPSFNVRPYLYYTREIVLHLIGNKLKLIELRGYGYNFFGRLGFFFLNCARKNQLFNDCFLKILTFVRGNFKNETQNREPGDLLTEEREISVPKKTISRFSDLSYHYIIVLEKR